MDDTPKWWEPVNATEAPWRRALREIEMRVVAAEGDALRAIRELEPQKNDREDDLRVTLYALHVLLENDRFRAEEVTVYAGGVSRRWEHHRLRDYWFWFCDCNHLYATTGEKSIPYDQPLKPGGKRSLRPHSIVEKSCERCGILRPEPTPIPVPAEDS